MSATGAELPTSLGWLGVHRSRFNPRGTLNSSKRLFVRFNDVDSAACTRDRVLFLCVEYREAESIWHP